MYQCPGCGSALKFDIEAQKLSCGHCGRLLPPDEAAVTSEEAAYYEANVFTCSQCGGEIYTQDSDVTGFCSYCGSNMSFESRLAKLKRPDSIVPFKITKDNCKRIYMKAASRAIFAPGDLKQEQFINEFRGIYMPFWDYTVSPASTVSLNGTHNYTKGSYDYHEEHKVTWNLDYSYPDIVHDASSSFADNISEKIIPYSLSNEIVPFSSAYLCGFYGETSDVDSSHYEPLACSIGSEATYRSLEQSMKASSSKITLKKPADYQATFQPTVTKTKQLMLPVWFLSYRNDDRVVYAAINGQTGKISVNFPVSIRKYLAFTFLLAIPLFFLFHMTLYLRPDLLTLLISLGAMIGLFLYYKELKQMILQDADLDNPAKMDSLPRKHIDFFKIRPKSYKDVTNNSKMLIMVISIVAVILFTAVITLVLVSDYISGADLLFYLFSPTNVIIIGLLLLLPSLLVSFYCMRAFKYGKEYELSIRPSFWQAQLAILLCAVCLAWRPVSDLIYYAFCVVSIILIVYTLIDLLNCYNKTTGRKPPQFSHQGGDDRA